MQGFEGLVGGVILIAGILAFKHLKKKKPQAAVGAAIGAGVLLLALVIYVVASKIDFGSGSATVDPAVHRQAYMRAVGSVIGQYINGQCPGGKPLIIAEKNYLENKDLMALIEELRKTIAVIAVEKPFVDYYDIDTQTEKPEAFLFNDMLRKHWYCDLVITLDDLPDNLDEVTLWRMPDDKRPKLVVYSNKTKKLRERIRQGLISLLVCRRPGDESALDSPAPAEARKAFDEHFLLIHPDNVDEMARTHKELFD
jgi:hypothetical protein